MAAKLVAAAALAAAAVQRCDAAALADLVPARARGGKLYADLLAREAADNKRLGVVGNSTANYFDQLIWHNDSSAGTFKQRYYVDTTFWTPSSTVVFHYIGGEGPLGGTPGGYVGVLAKQYNALIVALEHRYYGGSLPAPLTDRATLSSLSVESSLADTAAFIPWVRAQMGVPAAAKVVTIGGSYPGALAGWVREKYPDVTDASWSSSGVVDAVYNFTAFDAQIVADISTECADAIRAAYATFETMWDDPAQKPALLALFGTPTYFTKQDMAWMLADSAAMGPQYGAKDALCAAMLPSTNPIQQFAAWTNEHYGPGFGAQCYYSTQCLSDKSMSEQWPNQLPWVFQCCAELAYWQAAYTGSLRSSLITLDYFDGQCETAFGIKPNTTAFNLAYGGRRPNATQVIALNGSDDPWQQAAVVASLSPSYVSFMATCDGCGHCGDLHAPNAANPAVTAQQAAIATYMAAWLQ